MAGRKSVTAPYVVLLGDVGSGKSTIVEKLTGKRGRSSKAKESFTKTSELFWAPGKSILISDCPGTNPLKDKFEHNIWIAKALNFDAVSRIFIVVKADTRIDTVVHNIRTYAERILLNLPVQAIGVIVTHMDLVEWTMKDFIPLIVEELDIKVVVPSSLNTPDAALLRDILKVCKEKHKLSIDSEIFLKVFKLSNHNFKILKSTAALVQRFKDMVSQFQEERKKNYTGSELAVDLVFEFQAWMEEQVIESQKKLSYENNFKDFTGDGAPNAAGHVADMTSQLRVILYDVRVETLSYQTEHGVNELRKCPHCGLIWAKILGCDGETTCGNRLQTKDGRNPNHTVMGTFTFVWEETGSKLRIIKRGTKPIQQFEIRGDAVGCGKSICWKEMATVTVPSDFFAATAVSTDDVKSLPPTPGSQAFRRKIDQELASKLQLPSESQATVTVPPELSEAKAVSTDDVKSVSSKARFLMKKSNTSELANKALQLPSESQATVTVPSELSEAKAVSTDDVNSVPSKAFNFLKKLAVGLPKKY